MCGIYLSRIIEGKEVYPLPKETACGALGNYVSAYSGGKFQPSNINFGIMEGLNERIKNKQEKNKKISERSLNIIEEYRNEGKL